MLASPVSAEVGSLGSAFTTRCLFFPGGEVAICIFSVRGGGTPILRGSTRSVCRSLAPLVSRPPWFWESLHSVSGVGRRG